MCVFAVGADIVGTVSQPLPLRLLASLPPHLSPAQWPAACRQPLANLTFLLLRSPPSAASHKDWLGISHSGHTIQLKKAPENL